MQEAYTVQDLERLVDCLTVSAANIEARRLSPQLQLRHGTKLDSERLRVRGDILDWCRRALHDEVMKWVVAAIFLKLPDHSKPLARDLLAAGMRERNPSCNRVFLEPVRRREQWPQIVDWMIEIAESGGNLEKGGVARAAYHLQGGKPMDETSRRRLQSWMHLEFLRNEDLVAQRSLMPALDFDPASVDVEVKPFIEQAIDKASNSDDKYIRHRLGVQLGTHTGPFMMLDTSGDRDAD